MTIAQLTAGYKKTNSRRVFAIAASATLLCVIYLLRLSHLGIATSGSSDHSLYSPVVESHAVKPDVTNDVYNKTLGFEKIFVISLPERSDRRDSIILSAALSNIDIEIRDAVRGENVPEQIIPNENAGRFMKAEVGCWRSHMNIMQEVIQRNLSSILILEDDADWDIRIMDQLHDFALAAQAITQPLLRVYPAGNLFQSRTKNDIPFEKLPQTVSPEHSPYGDNWDLLWLGHCGVAVPKPTGDRSTGRVVMLDDPTVPVKKSLSNNLVGNDLGEYPDHTRLVHHATMGLCTQSYAITQAGARELMMSVGVEKMNTIDFGLREWCDGTSGRDPHLCLATQPAVFQPHRKAGPQKGDSDIDTAAHGDGVRKEAMTEVVRWSTILNWKALLRGERDFVDQYPDS
ncbi:hydroxylysine galactosyltransferase 1 [Hyphodiscus hymeniophilus]|uniref:Hydroxylysine galactosyltransferase 1 n=1 Tax=Hyphodiscus hymeniophilus TaxID=353542 RepID=A0A9P6VNY9_9HELO|nr:hydroxylysine galactosyltransferase 1 [Hyphodiscus hymeniophilus]